MRNLLCGLVAAIVVSSGAAALAANPKDCYAHSEDNSGVNYSAVWSNGGGHDAHEADIFLGEFETYAECLAAFDAL
jgi:hypothetical protein